jgi:hypothetical protein
MRLFAADLRAFVTTHGRPGPIANVATKSVTIKANIYLVFGEKTESVKVFWDLHDAEQWLDERLVQK